MFAATLVRPRWNLGWLKWVGGGTIVALSGLIIANTLPYFSFGTNFDFLREKGALAFETWWRAAFYMHISGGMVCLATGPVLLWNGLTRRSKTLHKWIGRTYGLFVLGWAGPSGLVLSFFAKGGIAGRLCFLLQVILWWGATLKGVQAAKAGRIADHRVWMFRSYALALSAVFFRVSQVGLYAAGVDDATNYLASLWISLVCSLVVGEMKGAIA